MSFTFLTPSAMTAVTKDMLHDQTKLNLLQSHPLTDALIPEIKAVYEDILANIHNEGDVSQRLKEISAQLAKTDQFHDRTARGLHGALESAAELVTIEDDAQRFLETRDDLFPEALTINTLSYREQAGNVIKVSERCTPQNRDVLARVAIDGVPLTHSFDRWVENGEEMGKLVSERALLSGGDDATRVSPDEIRKTRNRWARVMNTLIANLEFAIPDPEKQRTLLSNLREAEARAIRARQAELARQAAQNDATDEPTEPAPQQL